LKKWNTQRSNGMSSIIKNGKRNIGYSLHLVALRLLVSTLLNLVQVLAEVARRSGMVVLAPKLYGARRNFGALVRQNYVSCS
jgi:hypothetical protein